MLSKAIEMEMDLLRKRAEKAEAEVRAKDAALERIEKYAADLEQDKHFKEPMAARLIIKICQQVLQSQVSQE